jgi:acyl carrier protein
VLRDLVAEVLGVDPAEVAGDSSPLTLPGWTSGKHIELVVAVEESFGIILSGQDIRDMRSVAAVHGILARKGVFA